MSENERNTERNFYIGVVIGTLVRMGVNMEEVFKAIEAKNYDEAMRISFEIEVKNRESEEIVSTVKLLREVICLAIIPNQGEVRQKMSKLIAENAKKEKNEN